MRQELTINDIAIKGDIQALLLQTKIAIQGGAEFYECVSGRINFYRLQDELEYLTEVEKSYGITMDNIRKQIAHIREKQLSSNE